ncbi:MAG: hypothetical protein HY315_09570, partial [Acidobacteria bacterium]|nr:hypothetical protein [Acidobacteriota bacterium]
MSAKIAAGAAGLRTRRLAGFDDPAFGPDRWNRLLARGPTNVVHLTWQWQRAWWETLGRGTLLLVAAEQDGDIIAVAPLYVDEGMVFFVGSGESCFLDFIGEIDRPGVVDALLAAACDASPGLAGFRFYAVPVDSPTGSLLLGAAQRLGLDCYQ